MKMNKTLENIKKGAKIYGEKQLDRILNFKAVKSITREDNFVTINLENGGVVEATYSEIA